MLIRLFLGFALFCHVALVPGAKGQGYEKVFDFGATRTEEIANSPNKGSNLIAGLMQGSDGNFYGTTQYGGAGGFGGLGSVFRMTPEGVLKTLVEFTGNGASNKGSSPQAGLVQGSDGNFYGTTASGGPNNFGTVFKMTAAGVLTTLVEFTGNGTSNKGRSPYAGLVQSSDGNFYGTTQFGGASNNGTVFKMTAAGVLTTLVEFTGNGASNKGSVPYAGLVQGSDGSFYGTTASGGASGNGTVFKVTAAGVLTTIVEFTGNGASNKGSGPRAGLVQGSDGNFYGTTEFGGASSRGTVFKMTLAGVLTTIVELTGNGASNKGSGPRAGLVQGSDGSFYGTTASGGASDLGTVFKVMAAGGLTTLVEFAGNSASNKGGYPYAGLVQGNDGRFYGTTYGETFLSGAIGVGTVFRVTAAGMLTTLVEFTGTGVSNKGSSPQTGLVQGSDGNFYGTTNAGGASSYGTVFKMTAKGVVTTLVEFTGNGASNKGRGPQAKLVRGSDGNFYGTTIRGGGNDYGTVFKLTPTGVVTTLVEFTGNGASNKGNGPYAELVPGSDGNFYGTTVGGGASNLGTVFKMTSAGVLTTLVEFTGNGASNKGSVPYAGLVQGSDGNFYGTTASGGAGDYGTVFKMTAAGVLTTRVEFTSNGASNKGSIPYAKLVQGSDGNFYGTTVGGGASNLGTVFKMTSAGVLTTLVEFTGNGASNKGYGSQAGLVQGSDGSFYGTTQFGGASGNGTVFKMTAAGVLTTLVEFSDPSNGRPVAELLRTADGNFYGTFPGPDGGIFRLITPGAPSFIATSALLEGSTEALLDARVNARGASTTVTLEYGTDGTTFPNTVPIVAGLAGYQTKLVGTTLSGLAVGTTYFFRFRAVSSAGTTVSLMQSFSTLAEPVVSALAAMEIAPTSARFNGTVNARNFDATVVFEWGTDGNSFPNTVSAVPGLVTGIADEEVSAPVAGLVKDTTYFYRIVATNEAGTVVSGTSSFVTPTEAVVTVGGAFALTTTSARVSGSVRARDSVTQVLFDYGTDGVTFPNSVGAIPGTVSGDDPTAVSADLTNLSQGVTYYYRVRGESVGGTGTSAVAEVQVAVLSGFAQSFPGLPTEVPGFVTVNLGPPELLTAAGIKPAWRFVGEQQWRSSGLPVGGLAPGSRVVEFRPVPGYFQPLSEPVTVLAGGAETVFGEYFPSAGGATGGVAVTLKPDALASGAVPVAQRAQWRLLGEGDPNDPNDLTTSATWRDSGATAAGLPAGVYLIECKPVAGRATPPGLSVPVPAGQTSTATATYFLEDAPAGTVPGVLPFETVATSEALPYAFVGQLRSDAGASTGFVVKARVVATAGHVAFDDGTLSAATGLQWLFQRDRGSYEPTPQLPRGFYIFDGYAAQRIAENTPGESSPASQNLDAAALYFLEDAGRGGFGGFLASDATENEWLLSPALKTLVGYPVDGIAPANQGRMHATPAADVDFDPAFLRTFTTAGITSNGGNSGGPLCVQFEGGPFYPAAIYLGGTAQTVVRAIDSAIIDLFNRAEVSGNSGGNNTGGGITHVSSTQNAQSVALGAVRVNLGTAAALAAGGGWRFTTESAYRGVATFSATLAPGAYTVEFKPVSGFDTPPNAPVQLTNGVTFTINATYVPTLSAPVISGAEAITAGKGVAFSFSIVASNGPTSFGLTGTLPTGLGFNAGAGTITGTPTQSGSFALTLRATNGSGTGTKNVVLNIAPQITNTGAGVNTPGRVREGAFQFQIATGGDAIDSFGAEGLPPGMSVSAGGLVFGTPTRSGEFAVTLHATNAGGTDSKALALRIAPRIENASTFEVLSQLQSFAYTFSSPHDPATDYSFTGTLPPGLALNAAGVITGIPTASGVFDVVLRAENDGGEATQALQIKVPPQPVGDPAVFGSEGAIFRPYLVAVGSGDGTPIFEITGTLPAGLSFNANTGTISGIASASGIFPVTIKVTNGGGTTEMALTITIDPLLYFTLRGPGSVTPATDAKQDYPLGTPFALTAVAQVGAYFAGWSGDFPSGETALSFVLAGTRRVAADFQSFAKAKGTYTGLVQDSPALAATTGSLVLSLDKTGAFTGSLKIGKVATPLQGGFGADGKAQVALGSATLHLRLGIGTITGALDDGPATSEVLAVRSIYNGTTRIAPQAGKYTLAFAPDLAQPATPQGSGFGLATVTADGSVRLAATLADGSVVTQSAALSPDGRWPFFIPLANGKGSLAGVLTFHEDPALETIDGTLTWTKPQTGAKLYPDAFTAPMVVEGSRYKKNAELPANALITLNGGALTALPAPFTLARTGAKKYLAPGFALTLDPATGLFTGTFTAPGETKPRALGGVFLPQQQRAAGFFPGKTRQTGGFTLTPAP